MRPIEALLVFTNLAICCGPAVPWLRALPWLPVAVLLALILVAVQVLAEGPRWQMAPAYLLAIIFAAAWLLQRLSPAAEIIRPLFGHRIVAGGGIILCILSMAISVALPLILPVFQLPRPRGPYAVGTVTYHWTDTSRREIFSPDQARPRELIVQLWYPARREGAAPRAPYISDAAAVTTALARLHQFPDLAFQTLGYVASNAAESAPVADARPSYPLLIFLEGPPAIAR